MKIKHQSDFLNVFSKPMTLILFLLLVTAALRFLFLTTKSVVGDESSTVYMLQLSWWQLVSGQNYVGEFNPPFYFLFLKFWTQIFSLSEFSLRFPSALLSIATAPLLYWMGTVLIDRKGGLVALAIYAFSPLAITWAQMARSFSLTLFLSAASLLFTIYLLSRKELSRKKARLSYAALFLINGIGVYTHYFFVLIVIIEVLFCFLFYKRFRKQALRFFLSGLCLFVLYLPQLLQAYQHWQAVHSSIAQRMTFSVLSNVAINIFGLALGDTISPLNLPVVIPALCLFGGLGILFLKTLFEGHDPLWWMLFTIVLVFVLTNAFMGIGKPAYVIFALPAFILFMTKTIREIHSSFFQKVFLFAILVITSFPTAYWFSNDPINVIDAALLVPQKEIVKQIETNIDSEHDKIFLFPEWEYKAFEYYLEKDGVEYYSLSRKNYRQEIDSILYHDRPQRFWLIAKYVEGGLRDDLIAHIKKHRWKMIERKTFVPNTHLFDQFHGGHSEIYYTAEVLLFGNVSP